MAPKPKRTIEAEIVPPVVEVADIVTDVPETPSIDDTMAMQGYGDYLTALQTYQSLSGYANPISNEPTSKKYADTCPFVDAIFEVKCMLDINTKHDQHEFKSEDMYVRWKDNGEETTKAV